MDERDLDEFVGVMQDICHLYGDAKPLSPAQLKMYFKVCALWSLVDIRLALSAHVRDETRGRFFPKPADIAAQLRLAREADGRPGASEAWALALKANDEACTVVWTGEVASALRQVKPVLEQGDRYGARIAFAEVYERLVNQARNEGLPCEWCASLGQDPMLRTASVEEAHRQGRLPKATLLALENDLAGGNATEAFPQVSTYQPGIQLLLKWRESRLQQEGVRESEVMEDRRRVVAIKAATQKKVDQYLANSHCASPVAGGTTRSTSRARQ